MRSRARRLPRCTAQWYSRRLSRDGVVHLDVDSCRHLLPHSRNPEKDGRLDVTQVSVEERPAAAEVDDVPDAQRIDRRVQTLGDVTQREVRQHLVAGARLERLTEGGRRRHQVAVAEHRPLGWTGGARRVHDQGHVLGSKGSDAFRPLVLVPAAERLERFERHDLRIVHVVQHGARLDHDDVPEVWQAVAYFQHLVELLLVLGDEDDRLTVTQQVLDLRRRRRRVDADGYGADSLSADVGEQPFRPVRAVDRDSIAGTDAERVEGHPDPCRPGQVVTPRVGRPDPQLVMADCRSAAHLGGPRHQHFRQRRRAGGGVRPRHVPRHGRGHGASTPR